MTRPPTVALRQVLSQDLVLFHAQQSHPAAHHMAAFTRGRQPLEQAAFVARWQSLLADGAVLVRTVLADGEVVGHVARYPRDGHPELTYGIDRAWWGRGIATAALRRWLLEDPTRPLFAGAASDNVASLRVLEKCGFVRTGEERGFANARGCELTEVRMRLS